MQSFVSNWCYCYSRKPSLMALFEKPKLCHYQISKQRQNFLFNPEILKDKSTNLTQLRLCVDFPVTDSMSQENV